MELNAESLLGSSGVGRENELTPEPQFARSQGVSIQRHRDLNAQSTTCRKLELNLPNEVQLPPEMVFSYFLVGTITCLPVVSADCWELLRVTWR